MNTKRTILFFLGLYIASFLFESCFMRYLSQKTLIQEEEVRSSFWAPIEEVRDILTFDNLKELWDEVMEVYDGKINF